jgi:dTDP-4-dehydrorhamnose 3,5-epimerase
MPTSPIKETQSVTPQGESVAPRIDGVVLRPAVTIPDERGTICEIFNPAWGFSDTPLVYVYQITIRPGRLKSWAKHLEQDDRLFVSLGAVRIALYDDRSDSPTYKMLNVLYVTEQNRGILLIPRGVYHAVQNIGQTDALLINLPTKAYDHANPDKYRLPTVNDVIPYRFD